MNNLSWLIYFADIVRSLSAAFTVLTLGFAFSYFVTLLMASEGTLKQPKHWFITVAFITGFIATMLPSKNTVYAIAASELGEQVLVSHTGKKAVAALEAWLDAQVKGLK